MTPALFPLAALTLLWMAYLLPKATERQLASLRERRPHYTPRRFLLARAAILGMSGLTFLVGCAYLYTIAVAWLWATGRLDWITGR